MNKLGQGEVLATVLLVLIVVVAFSGIWIWYMGRYSGEISHLYREKEKATISMNEKIIIEKVFFIQNNIDVFVTNMGAETDVSTLYINDNIVYSGNTRLLSGSSLWINVSYSWISKSVYNVKVCTYLGNCFEVNVRAP